MPAPDALNTVWAWAALAPTAIAATWLIEAGTLGWNNESAQGCKSFSKQNVRHENSITSPFPHKFCIGTVAALARAIYHQAT